MDRNDDTRRPAMLRNALATERGLVMWIRTFFWMATLGMLLVSVALLLWQQRDAAESVQMWLRNTAGFALIALGSAVLCLGMITGGTGIRRWQIGAPARSVISAAVGFTLGVTGLLTAVVMVLRVRLEG